jgi:hypothetical protein
MDEEEWEEKNPANISASHPANSIQQYFMFLHSGEQFLLIFLLNPGTLCSP